MYAVIRTGGKQYRVAPDDVLQIEKVEAAEGEVIELGDVLMLSKNGQDVQVGAPVIDGARVAAEVIEQGRGEKIIVFKKKRRQNYRRKNGHRQALTTIRVLELLDSGDKSKKSASKKDKEAAKTGAAPKTSGSAKDAKAKRGESGKSESKPAAAADGKKAEARTKPKKAHAQKKSPDPAASGFKKLDAPQGEADDLKLLPGVGQKLAEKLNTYGIFHFHQLASMSEDDVNEMESELALRGRAKRDDWVGQAKQFMEEES